MKRKLFIAVLVLIIAFPITIAFPAKAKSTDFTDVSTSHSAYSEIMSLKTKGFINGYPNGTFNPTAPITRMHVSALFARSLDLPPTRPGNEFNDVPKNHPYYNDIQKVYRAGIFDGKNESNFEPNAILTRAQMAKILHLAFDFETHTENVFSDVSSNHWAKDHIATLYAYKVTTGNAGKFNPNGYVSRAHYAVFLDRALKSNSEVYTQRVKEIQTKWNMLKPSYTGPIMAEEASIVPPYRLGKVHHTELAEALNLTNFVRSLSYLPSNIKLNELFNEEAQASSLVNAVNQSMSHTPLQPVGMSKALFDLGYAGAYSSNIGVGYLDIKSSINIGYMPDDSDGNRESVGHRRWILSPYLQEVGFGYAIDSNGRGHTAMKVVAPNMWNNPSVTYDMITWPSKTAFPTDFFGSRDPWSVSLNEDIYDPALVDNIIVQLTRVTDGKKWTFSKANQTNGYFNINHENIGQTPYTIIFQPDNIGEYRQGDHYQVEIRNVYKKNGQQATILFETTFFDLQ